MRKRSIRLSLASLLAALLLIAGTPAMAVYAEDGSSGGSHDGDSSTTTSTSSDDSNTSSGTNDDSSTTTNHETETETKTENETASHSASDQKSRNQTGKQRACQNREHAINNILARIADRGQKQLDLFTTIATRVEAFYVAKGKTLGNYDALVADINAKHMAAQATVNTIKASSVTFSCNESDPKATATSFKDSLKAEIAALKAYKTAVKNLIVGVKSVQSTTAEAEQNTGGNQ